MCVRVAWQLGVGTKVNLLLPLKHKLELVPMRSIMHRYSIIAISRSHFHIQAHFHDLVLGVGATLVVFSSRTSQASSMSNRSVPFLAFASGGYGFPLVCVGFTTSQARHPVIPFFGKPNFPNGPTQSGSNGLSVRYRVLTLTTTRMLD